MSYVNIPLRTSGRATLAAKGRFGLKTRPSVLTDSFMHRPPASSARGINLPPSKGKQDARSRRQFLTVFTISASAVLAVLFYWRRNKLRMDSPWDKERKTAAVDPKPAPSLGKPIPPDETAEKPFPVVTPQPTSTKRSITFVPGEKEKTVHSYLGAYGLDEAESLDVTKLPREECVFTAAPNVPPPITRDYPVLLEVPLVTSTKVAQLTSQFKYEKWTFNKTVPGPFIRARVGDVVELSLTNRDVTGNPHNIDSHAFTGPGGGSALTTVEENQTKTARFKLLWPGLYVYHCAAAPLPVHIANGMYGLMYVQPEEGDLPPVDHEYYVMQSEFYHEPPEELEDGRRSQIVEFSYPNALREDPQVVVFNGSESALTRDRPLTAKVNETVRIFFGNAGPNLTSSFHALGTHFINAYLDGDVLRDPAHFMQTVSVPPGSAAIMDLKMFVPGTYALVDHAIFRLDKGAVGYLNVSGKPRPDIYQSALPPNPCVGCKLHP